MDIKRINTYDDVRFSSDVLAEHGAFVIDNKYPCSFKITNEKSARVEYHDYTCIAPIIDFFRFFAEHITVFYDTNGRKIAEFPQIETRIMRIDELQPSQFFVDTDKLKAVSSFVKSTEDMFIPIAFYEKIGRYISLDGHTRLYFAQQQGIKNVRVFITDPPESIYDFADEAINRGVKKVSDMEVLPHDEYDIRWNKFCDDFFQRED